MNTQNIKNSNLKNETIKNETYANVYLTGQVIKKPEYRERIGKTKYYTSAIRIKRLSDKEDIIPIVFAERMISEIQVHKMVRLEGEYCSKDIKTDKGNRMEFYVKAHSVEVLEDNVEMYDNVINLTGYICKNPIYRTTPTGIEITDIMLATNKNKGRSYYFPCVFWNNDARKMRNYKTGNLVAVTGRIQSREYTKRLEDGTVEKRIAYEISVISVTTGGNDGNVKENIS